MNTSGAGCNKACPGSSSETPKDRARTRTMTRTNVASITRSPVPNADQAALNAMLGNLETFGHGLGQFSSPISAVRRHGAHGSRFGPSLEEFSTPVRDERNPEAGSSHPSPHQSFGSPIFDISWANDEDPTTSSIRELIQHTTEDHANTSADRHHVPNVDQAAANASWERRLAQLRQMQTDDPNRVLTNEEAQAYMNAMTEEGLAQSRAVRHPRSPRPHPSPPRPHPSPPRPHPSPQSDDDWERKLEEAALSFINQGQSRAVRHPGSGSPHPIPQRMDSSSDDSWERKLEEAGIPYVAPVDASLHRSPAQSGAVRHPGSASPQPSPQRFDSSRNDSWERKIEEAALSFINQGQQRLDTSSDDSWERRLEEAAVPYVSPVNASLGRSPVQFSSPAGAERQPATGAYSSPSARQTSGYPHEESSFISDYTATSSMKELWGSVDHPNTSADRHLVPNVDQATANASWERRLEQSITSSAYSSPTPTWSTFEDSDLLSSPAHQTLDSMADFSANLEKQLAEIKDLDESDENVSSEKKEEPLLEWFDKGVEQELEKRRYLTSNAIGIIDASKAARQKRGSKSPPTSPLAMRGLAEANAAGIEIVGELLHERDAELIEAVEKFATAEAMCNFAGAVEAAEEAAKMAPPERAEEAAAAGARDYQKEITGIVQRTVPGDHPVEVLGYVGVTRPKNPRKPNH